MSFQISLLKNSSEKNRVDKSLQNIATLQGTLKDNTSIINPVIIVEKDAAALADCNYMEISTFNRSYFITDIVSINSNMCEISAHVDVVSSFWDEYKVNMAIIGKQENKYNLHVNDGTFLTYQNSDVVLTNFPSGFGSTRYVLAVAGGTGSNINDQDDGDMQPVKLLAPQNKN